MIIATATRPRSAAPARLAGLFAHVGNMLALRQLGKTYCETAKSPKTKNLAYRLEKDHKLQPGVLLVQHLRAKGVPEKLVAPYSIDEELKSPADVELRLCVRAAVELVEARDAGKLELYQPGRTLPAQSSLRLLQLNTLQQERIYNVCSDYLTRVAEQEAPEGASLVISSFDFDETVALGGQTERSEPISVPVYPSGRIAPKSRERLKDFMLLCEQERNPEELKRRAIEYLRDSGLFHRAALVRVEPGSDEAIVEYSLGLEQTGGSRFSIGNPLSPFHTFKMDMRSCNVKAGSFMAPFGVTAYAVGPVDLSAEGDRLVLYADRGSDGALSMESRRVFRLALGLLMQSLRALRLAALPGGAPAGAG